MLHVTYRGDLWCREFELTLSAASRLDLFAENLWNLYSKIKEDNSYEFCGPLRVPYILCSISGYMFVTSQLMHLMDKDRLPTFKLPKYHDKHNLLNAEATDSDEDLPINRIPQRPDRNLFD